MNKKATNVQRQTLKGLQKAWRTAAQDHFKKITGKSGSFEKNYKEMRGGTRRLQSAVNKQTDWLKIHLSLFW